MPPTNMATVSSMLRFPESRWKPRVYIVTTVPIVGFDERGTCVRYTNLPVVLLVAVSPGLGSRRQSYTCAAHLFVWEKDMLR
ncbi:hypothetical protein LshimejAT787_0905900 [Lyophyllum shimeji]|uniref:Uncharacterized protein n=1 Tax=Lyophyllum shimeji TaxID=47721 RepID=A0A9P3PST4_LYOSH|nr:hypothetical protein LshimejAT787_0905900 [Lyophyllum shimeji]